MNIRNNVWAEPGYTLVETLVASALLLSVLVPAILFLGKVSASQKNRDLLIATQLATETMEKTVQLTLFSDEQETLSFQNTTWRVAREVKRNNGLVEIRIWVFKITDQLPLIELSTMRVDR